MHDQTYIEDENPIRQYLGVINRRKKIILLIFLVCLPFVLIKAFSGTPVYTATAKLLIKRNMDPALVSTNPFYFYDPHFLKTQNQLIKSSKVADEVVKILNLDETYDRYFEAAQPSSNIFNHVFTWGRSLFSFGKNSENKEPHAVEPPELSKTEITPDEANGKKHQDLSRKV